MVDCTRMSGFWPEASVRSVAAIRPVSGVKPTCQDSSTDAFDPLLRRRSSLLALQYSYSIGSSALSRIDVGTSRPSALAVVILSTVSYFTDNCTGRSAGFSLLRMRST